MKLHLIRKNTGYVCGFLTQQFFIQGSACSVATSEATVRLLLHPLANVQS
jgi:hypothetical protein